MSYAAYPKATLLIPTNGTDKHLFVVVTKRCQDAGHLLLSITSIGKKSHDTTCTFSGGEHDFIRHPSYVAYKFATQLKAALITKFVDNGYYAVRADLDVSHFARVCAGIDQSPFTKPWVIKYFNQNC